MKRFLLLAVATIFATTAFAQSIREEIENVNQEIQLAERNYDLNKAAELKYGRLPELKKQLEAFENNVKNASRSTGSRKTAGAPKVKDDFDAGWESV